MRHSPRLSFAGALLALTVASASNAEDRCIIGMNKSGAKVAAAALKDAASCARLAVAYKLPPGMSAVDCLSADLRSAVGKAQARVLEIDERLCAPPASFGYAGPATVNDAGTQLAADLVADLFGNGFQANAVVTKIQTQLVKNVAKLVSAELRAFVSCKQKGFAAGAVTDEASLSACLAALDVTGGKLDALRAKLEADVARTLGNWSLTTLFAGRCVFEDDFFSCVSTRSRCRACEALNRMDDLSMDCEAFDDGLLNGSCGPCIPDPDGFCCNSADRDACGYCGGTGFRCDWAQVSVATTHACGRKLDGSLACWGKNFAGELGAPAGVFTDVASGGSVSEAVNKGHSCAVDTNQDVTCWGRNDYGQASPPSGSFTQLAAGSYHTCGLRTDGSIDCWGNDGNGQSSPPAGTFLRIGAKRSGNCALRADGAVVCWGTDAGYGGLTPLAGPFLDVEKGALATYAIRPDQTVAHWGGDDLPQFVPPPGTFTKVAAGEINGCGLRLDGSVECWPDPPVVPHPVGPPLGVFQDIAAGERIYCGIRADDSLTCWGDVYTQSEAPPK